MILPFSSVRISAMDAAILARIASETGIPESSVSATVSLLEKGATGPFIVHYRKEATGGLDGAKVRSIQERITYYREVLDQRAALLKLLSDQGKLTDELRARVESCFSKVELEDLHHQFRPKKRSRATEAIEKGLEPLAEYFWNQEADAWSVEEHLDVFVDPAKGVATREQALQGAVDILAEWIWENFECRKALRELLWNEGFVVSSVVPAKVGQKTKYTMYYDRRESVTSIPSHRVLAIRRGCKEGILVSSIEGDGAKALECILSLIIKDKESVFAPVLEAAAKESYNRILRPLIESQVRAQLKERADREAIRVFQENLANLLLSPPAGPIVVMGIDWGKGDECSVAVVDESGGFLEGAKVRFTPAPAPPRRGPAVKDAAETEKPQAPVQEAAPASPEPETAAQEKESGAQDTESPGQESGINPDGSVAPPADQGESAAQNGAEQELPLETASSDAVAPEPISGSDGPPDPGVTRMEAPSADPGQTSPPDPASEAAAEPASQTATVSQPLQAETSTVPGEPPSASEPAPGEAAPQDPAVQARAVIKEMLAKHHVRAVAIGAGTGARELETVLRRIVSEEGLRNVMIAAVNDAGIAVYSSSRIAREEFPEMNASARCAVSLARRLQDPLAELVKIDPKLIGVGQYQHDVDQKELHRGLLQTVQYCVNKVGVNVNTAGETLLRYVSGLNERLARKIAACRKSQGPFRSRASIMSAVGMDESTYRHCAGFLRIPDGENALDRTAVHPEAYPVVEKMAAALNVAINDLVGNRALAASLKLEDFVTETVGMPTLKDIRDELMRPGRDPRRTFKVPKFRADVKDMADLKPGMTLEGTVTNVTNFGAFVDIGVRQDGLVHLSQMSNRFIRDPREAVRVGDVVQVKVISVEPETKRIGLSMKALLPPGQRRRKKQQRKDGKSPAPDQATAEPAGTQQAAEAARTSEQAVDPAHGSPQARSGRPQGRPPRYRRGARRSGARGDTKHAQEGDSKPPEPTLQEKIAILQSKFRGIN